MMRRVRFVSEFGAQSVPESAAAYIDPSRWPALDWESLREHHGLEVEVMQQRGLRPTTRPATRGAARRSDTRSSCCATTSRRCAGWKYRPTGGFAFSWLADPAPMISAAVLDHDRVPKLAWSTIVETCRPVIVVTDPLPAELVAGDELTLDVHVVSDLRVPVVDATVSVTCRRGEVAPASAGRSAGRRVAADSGQLVGRLEAGGARPSGRAAARNRAAVGDDELSRPVSATRRRRLRRSDPSFLSAATASDGS